MILKVPFWSCVQDKSKTFFYSCNQCPSPFSTTLSLSHILALRHMHKPALLCCFPRPWFSLECWHQIASLQQSTPLGGICILFAYHYRFNRANCAPSCVKMMRGVRGKVKIAGESQSTADFLCLQALADVTVFHLPGFILQLKVFFKKRTIPNSDPALVMK